MHLLNTETHRLESFQSGNVPFYAILSHTWGSDEIVFGDIGNSERCLGERYDKVSMTCSIAKQDGFDYVWIDTCCIDKTSSAELSEAINSMYLWYQEAGRCYAYLADVPPNAVDGRTGAICPEFFESRWFTRGWTLQELIAPSNVIFFDKSWGKIGTKLTMKATISKITGIPDFILEEGELERASIAQRMSWASKRMTTRIEDRAYCLMGIFGVNMPMLYGEGEAAFIRLQEEILKVSDDHSIFAWQSSNGCGSLLATSPAAFSGSKKIIPVDSSSVLSGAITINNKGIHLRIRFMDISRLPSQSVQLAILPCAVEDEPEKKVALYMKAISQTHQYFVRTKSNRFELMNLTDSSRFKYTEENICVRQNRQKYKRQSSLVKAAEKGNLKLVKALIEERVELDEPALLSAAENGHGKIVNLLLDNGFDLNYTDKRGRTALTSAAENGHMAIIKLLLDKRISFDEGVLISAAKNGHEEIVKLLLEKGIDPSYADESGQTPLISAAENGHVEVMKLLLEEGAEADEGSIIVAAKNGHEKAVMLLLEQDADPSLALSTAADNGQEALVKLLLDKGTYTELESLDLAIESGNEGLIKILLKTGAELEIRALMAAIELGRESVVDLLLKTGVKPTSRMLISAVKSGHKGIAKLLLENDAKPHRRALLTAAEKGFTTVAKLLLEKGIEPSPRALELAVDNRHEEMAILLLESGIKPTKFALSSATGNGQETMVMLLLEKGAEPGIRELELAVKNGHEGIMMLLLENGVY